MFYKIEALLEVSLGKKIQKKNGNKEIEAKNCVKLWIFSEGRRQDFSSDHNAFQNRSKKLRMLEITTSIWEFLEIFSRKDVGRKKSIFCPRFKIINFYFDGRQQDESTCHWQDPPGGGGVGAGAPPKCRPPSFLVVGGWVNHEVASIWLKIVEQVAYG